MAPRCPPHPLFLTKSPRSVDANFLFWCRRFHQTLKALQHVNVKPVEHQNKHDDRVYFRLVATHAGAPSKHEYPTRNTR